MMTWKFYIIIFYFILVFYLLYEDNIISNAVVYLITVILNVNLGVFARFDKRKAAQFVIRININVMNIFVEHNFSNFKICGIVFTNVFLFSFWDIVNV